jgi:pimeloyl-ACP methyl ester carboxylesterase
MKPRTPLERRRFLQFSLGVAASSGAAAAIDAAAAHCVPPMASAPGSLATASATTASRSTCVLVHGAWHGAWCWSRMAPHLLAAGHRVLAPTLTGLGASQHLLRSGVGLGTHIDDVVGCVESEEPGPIVLVGHSYGGMVVAGAADRLRDRVERLVLLDTVVPQDRQSLAEIVGADPRKFVADATVEGIALPVPPLDAFGVPENHPEAGWLRRRLTPQPVATFLEPLVYRHGGLEGLDVHYVRCTAPSLSLTAKFALQARSRGYPVHELETGHDAMVLAPAALAGVLVGIARTAGED